MPTTELNGKNQKVLFVHHGYGWGGAPNSLSLLLRYLDRSRYTPRVLLPLREANRPIQTAFEALDLDVEAERQLRPFNGSTIAPVRTWHDRFYAILGAPITLIQGVKHTRNVRPDLVHLNSSCLVFFGIGVKLACTGAKVVIHLREPAQTGLWGRAFAWLTRNAADGIISLDRFGLASFGLDESDPMAIRIVENAMETQALRVDTAYESRTRFGYLARFTEGNGLVDLLELLKQIEPNLDGRIEVHCYGASDPSAATPSPYEQRARELAADLTFVHIREHTDDVVGAISAVDCIIAPFVVPHSARSVIEGAVQGKPAIVTDIGSLNEQVVDGETGLLFAATDPNSLLKSMNSLARDPELRGLLGNNAKERALKLYDPARSANEVSGLFDDVLGRSTSNINVVPGS